MSHKPDFHEEMDRLQGHMPGWAGRNFDRLRRPRAIWVRVPAGIALTGGGVLGFLPVLGVWMLPVGLALLARDVPPMRGRLHACCISPTTRSSKEKSGERAKKRASPLPRQRRPAQ
jgi:hypothetical protein